MTENRVSESYVTNLVNRLNDDARAVRISALALLLTALYLSVIVLSANDEAIFRDSATQIPQLGVSVSLFSSFTLAPPIFIFLHANVLLQVYLLSNKIRHFEITISKSPFKKNFRSLLSGVSFLQVQALTEDDANIVTRVLLNILVFFTLYAVPFALMIIVELSFLRYQSDFATNMHRTLVTMQFALMVWFYKNTTHGKTWKKFIFPTILSTPCIALILLMWKFSGVPSPQENTVIYNHNPYLWKSQPIDYIACGKFHIGCRSLDLRGRLLISTNQPQDSLNSVEAPNGGIDRIAGLSLSGRSLLFAQLSGSRLYNADLSDCHLENAQFVGAQLQGAVLAFAKVDHTWFIRAQLQGADMEAIEGTGTVFTEAELEGANLEHAQLYDVDFNGTHMEAAYMFNSVLSEKNLHGDTFIQGADIERSILEGNLLERAHIWRTNFGENPPNLDRAIDKPMSLDEYNRLKTRVLLIPKALRAIEVLDPTAKPEDIRATGNRHFRWSR